MKNLLAITNESKMTWFNYSSMDRTNTYFVKLFAFYFVKRVILHPGILIHAIEHIAHRLQPGMILIRQPKVFVQLPFKELKTEMSCCERREIICTSRFKFS